MELFVNTFPEFFETEILFSLHENGQWNLLLPAFFPFYAEIIVPAFCDKAKLRVVIDLIVNEGLRALKPFALVDDRQAFFL